MQREAENAGVNQNKCSKVSFQSRKEALKHARHIQVNQRHFSRRFGTSKANKKLRSYYCGRCGMYHLTTQKPYKGKNHPKPRQKS